MSMALKIKSIRRLAIAAVASLCGLAITPNALGQSDIPSIWLRSSTTNPEVSDGYSHISRPMAICIDKNGQLLIADRMKSVIRIVEFNGNSKIIAGSETERGFADGPAVQSRLNYPSAIAIDKKTGLIYVADAGNRVIRRISLAGNMETIAGIPGVSGDSDGPLGRSKVDYVEAIAVGPNGDVYFTDHDTVRRISKDGVVTTIAGSSEPRKHPGMAFDQISDGNVKNVMFIALSGIAVTNNGDIFLADPSASTIRKISAASGLVTTIAGLPRKFGFRNGHGNEALFLRLGGIASGNDGFLYAADPANHAIRKISIDGEVSTVAGNPKLSVTKNGTIDNALFANPSWLDVNSLGDIYVSDPQCQCIRIIEKSGQVRQLKIAGINK